MRSYDGSWFIKISSPSWSSAFDSEYCVLALWITSFGIFSRIFKLKVIGSHVKRNHKATLKSLFSWVGEAVEMEM